VETDPPVFDDDLARSADDHRARYTENLGHGRPRAHPRVEIAVRHHLDVDLDNDGRADLVYEAAPPDDSPLNMVAWSNGNGAFD
jgi:hypothetical protein